MVSLLQWEAFVFSTTGFFCGFGFFFKSRGAGQPQEAKDKLGIHEISFRLRHRKGKWQRLVGFSKGKEVTYQKCQCAGQDIFKLLLGKKHLGSLVPDTFLSFYLEESEAKEQQS